MWNFNATCLLYIFIEVHRNTLELKKMSKNLNEKRTGSSQGQKLACSDNLRKNIWKKME